MNCPPKKEKDIMALCVSTWLQSLHILYLVNVISFVSGLTIWGYFSHMNKCYADSINKSFHPQPYFSTAAFLRTCSLSLVFVHPGHGEETLKFKFTAWASAVMYSTAV